MGGGFDYSKWDKLELSDDEDDHPGAQFIEANTLRRIKRQSHEQKTTEKNQKIQSLMGDMKDALKTIAAGVPRAASASITGVTPSAGTATIATSGVIGRSATEA